MWCIIFLFEFESHFIISDKGGCFMSKKYEPPIILSIDKLQEIKPQCTIALKPKRACKSLPSGMQSLVKKTKWFLLERWFKLILYW